MTKSAKFFSLTICTHTATATTATTKITPSTPAKAALNKKGVLPHFSSCLHILFRLFG
jgi:hypothetical protein